MSDNHSFRGDSLKTRLLFESNNAFGFPSLPHLPQIELPKSLVAFRTKLAEEERQDVGIHFFMKDQHLEAVWSHPDKALKFLEKYQLALSPDFSFYADMPYSLQLFNVYRNRWAAAFWRYQGIQVVPTVAWADEKSYDFCFAGLPKYSVLAVSTLGSKRHKVDRLIFQRGFEKMLEVLEPSQIICFGKLMSFMQNLNISNYLYHFCRGKYQEAPLAAEAIQRQPQALDHPKTYFE